MSAWIPIIKYKGSIGGMRHYVILRGESGYIGTPYRVHIGYWCNDRFDWLTHSNDRFADDGTLPTHYMEIPE